MWCAMSEDDDNTIYIHLSRFHVLCVGLGFHVLIGVGHLIVRFHHAHVIPSFLLGCSPTFSCHRQLRLQPLLSLSAHRENGSFEVLSLQNDPTCCAKCNNW